MLEFFRTASGGYNYVLMASVIAWIASTGVIAANFYKHRSDTISAQKAAKTAKEEKDAEEQRRIDAERRLATAEAKIIELTPPPLKVRLKEILNSIDPQILPHLAKGQTQFFGEIRDSDKRAIEDIRKEPGAADLIMVRSNAIILPTVGSDESQHCHITLILSPDILKE